MGSDVENTRTLLRVRKIKKQKRGRRGREVVRQMDVQSGSRVYTKRARLRHARFCLAAGRPSSKRPRRLARGTPRTHGAGHEIPRLTRLSPSREKKRNKHEGVPVVENCPNYGELRVQARRGCHPRVEGNAGLRLAHRPGAREKNRGGQGLRGRPDVASEATPRTHELRDGRGEETNP